MTGDLAFDQAVADLREWLRDRQDEGADCPVCGQHVRVYRRSIRREHVEVLTAMYLGQRKAARIEGGRPTEKWVHLPDVPQRSRDVATCAYFGLIDQDPERRGWWRITLNGVRFLIGNHTVPKYALVLHNERIGFDGEHIDVQGVAPGFDLEALTRGDSDGDD